MSEVLQPQETEMVDDNTDKAIESEVIEERGLQLRRPSVPTTISELSSLAEDQGHAIIKRRTDIFNTLRLASIQLTMPGDWTLFRAVDDRGETITGFLGDQGCDRIKKLWGIQVHNLTEPARIEAKDGTFAYQIFADGICGLTGESVFNMEGIRYSIENYAKEKPEGIQREVAVRKAARANLDGSITRELAGMKSVPVEELDKAWEGTWKKSSGCNKGRGFGSKDQRMGVGDDKSGGVDPADVPSCDICKVKLVYRPAKKFWGCPSYQKHPDDKVIVNHDDLLRMIAERKKASAQRQPGDEQ